MIVNESSNTAHFIINVKLVYKSNKYYIKMLNEINLVHFQTSVLRTKSTLMQI